MSTFYMQAGTLDTPHTAEVYAAPDSPQRDAPVSRCCSACIRGSRALGLRPCGRKMACGCHEKQPGRFVVMVGELPHAVVAKSTDDARVVAFQRFNEWPTAVEKVGA